MTFQNKKELEEEIKGYKENFTIHKRAECFCDTLRDCLCKRNILIEKINAVRREFKGYEEGEKNALKNELGDFYSELSSLINSLNDDLTLDLGKGESGYKSYEESYNAIRKNTLRLLNRRLNKIQKRLEELNKSKNEK